MSVRRFNQFSAAAWQLCIVLALAGCGGGGGGSSGGTVPAPTISFSANPTTVNPAGSSQLTWTVTNVASCTSSGGWAGNRDASGTATTGPLFATTTFNLSCSSAGGTTLASVTITVLPLPGITITATPRIVRTGVTSQLTWAVTDATSCEASEGWSGARPLSGTETVGPLMEDTRFSLTCIGTAGTSFASASVDLRAGTNAPPTANAGQDLTVFSTTSVFLSGANSSDDNGIASFAWTQTAGPAISLSNPNIQSPVFVAPTVAADTVLTFSLTVTDDEGAVSAPDTVNVTVQPVPPMVMINGAVNYELIPFAPPGNFGLSYAAKGFFRVQSEVLIEALDAGTLAVLASGRFALEYQLTVPSQRDIVLRATAEITRQAPLPPPHWQISVRDLDANGAPLGPIHAYTGLMFNSGAGVRQDLNIPSGWSTTAQLVGPRHAAPFAILESIRRGLSRILEIAPNTDFPPLTIDWGPNNLGGETFFTRDANGARIVLSAEPNVDTEEYDPSVILHEFGHYLDDAFSRSDSLGGPHRLGERLDLRVAFGEGLATALSAIANGSSYYRDSFGPSQQSEGFFDIENDSAIAEGWYSESSCQEILWDVFDDLSEAGDNTTLGLAPIWETLQSTQRQTDAMTSIFSFMTALKQMQPSQAAAINMLLANEQIVGPAMDIYGSTETNNAGSNDVLPIYTSIALGGSVLLRSTNEFGTPNKLSSHRYLRLSLPATTNVRFDLTAAAGRDPDIQVFRRGVPLGPAMGPSDETFTLNLAAGDYVLDVYDCGNAGCNPGVTQAPTDMTIAVTPN